MRTMTTVQLLQMTTERYYWVYILGSSLAEPFTLGSPIIWFDAFTNIVYNVVAGFTKDYNVHRLVYFEPHTDVEAAIRREKRLKRWNRAWKIGLIEENNPNWDDLYPKISSP